MLNTFPVSIQSELSNLSKTLISRAFYVLILLGQVDQPGCTLPKWISMTSIDEAQQACTHNIATTFFRYISC